MVKLTKCCRECGRPLSEFPSLRPNAVFCTVEHRKQWNNRRAIRGAEIYDLLMAENYQRDKRSPLELRGTINRLLRSYRDADKALRDGRESWNVEERLAQLPLAFSNEGDGR